MVSLNFLRGKVLIVSTGYYSDRLYNLALFAKKTHNFIKKIDKVEWNDLDKVKKNTIGFGLVIQKQVVE